MFESIVLIEVTRSGKARKHIEESVAKNTCCNCSTNPIWKNGICRKCHYKIEKICNDLPKQKREVFKSKLYRLGKMLFPQEVRFWKSKDALDAIADEVK